MFDKTWAWAGTFRLSNKNIDVDWTQVAVGLKNLLDNTQYRIAHTVYETDEIAARLHHELVWIHCFANSNGRHARLLTDTLLTRLGQPKFSWGSNALVENGDARFRYIAALQMADRGDIDLLWRFARS